MKDNYSKRIYKCKCNNIQEEYVWKSKLAESEFNCNLCSSILNYSNLEKKEVNQSAAIRTPTKNR
jgi:hypothetical protein